MTTRTVRAWNGRRKAPLSAVRRREAKEQYAVAGGIIGGFPGTFAGPLGVTLGAAIGAHLGYQANPDEN